MVFKLALRQLWRDWRAGELIVLALALIIAVASVSSVDFFTSRVHKTLEGQANELLGGDLVLLSSEPISENKKQQVAAAGLRSAETVEFPTMVLAKDNNQLVALKAVSRGYPLRGRHRTASELFGPDVEVEGSPQPGTVWAGSRLLTILGINVGDMVTVGATELKVAAVLMSEPDQSEGVLFNIAPRLLMHTDDLPATQLIQPASRVMYRLLLAGELSKINQIRQQWQDDLAPGESLRNVKDARPEVRSALAKGESFLDLAALVSVLLSGAAVAMAARRFVSCHLDNCAVMRCLGASQSLIGQLYIIQMLVLGFVASAVGVALGYLAQWGLIGLLEPLAGVALPEAQLWPALWGMLTGMITLMGFAIPPVLQLKDVPTLSVLRRDLGRIQPNTLLAYTAGFVSFMALVLMQAQDIKLAIAIILGLVLVLGLLGLIASGLLLLLRPMRRRGGAAWNFGLVNMSRRTGHSVVQMIGFSVGLMALLLLAVVRTDLLSEWEGRLPDDAPNRFLINIQPDQLKQVQEFFKAEDVTAPLLYPMVRARLTEINGRPVSPDQFKTDRGKRLVQREFNISWASDLQEDNKITTGRWWGVGDSGKPFLSVEESLVKELGLALGDTLTYDVAGQQFTAEITSFRSVKWDSLNANFFVITPPGLLDGYPVNYISGFYLSAEKREILDRLVQRFPNITVLDMATIFDQIRLIIERVTMAVEYVFLFTVLAGLMVMYAAIYATLDERIREAAIFRTLGARRGQLMRSIILEYSGLGLLSGLVAAITAGVIGIFIAESVFQLTYMPGAGLWLGGMLVGAVGVGIAGTLGTRFVINQPPLQTLRGV